MIRILGSLSALLLLSLACFSSLRLAWADHLFQTATAPAVERAVQLAPGNARYLARWAALLENSAPLEAALTHNPRDAASWMELGLRAEAGGDLRKAERCLLQAARVDRQYNPRWTLANFYFRRGDLENFWLWAAQAAAISYVDNTALFRLLWKAAPDPEQILSRAIPPQLETSYLRFLLAENHLPALESAARRVAARAGRQDAPLLLAACDRLLDQRQFPSALRLWTLLCERELVPYPAPQPERGAPLTNGDFQTPLLSRGFDWRLDGPGGVSVTRADSPSGLRITFTGSQPEVCDVVSQFVPVLPAKQYRLRFRYRTSHIAPGAGLRWRIFDPAAGADLAQHSPDLASEQEIEQEALFSTPAETRMVRLALRYHRALGTTRLEGSTLLRHASMEFAPR
jgi:tetratricopeptide (TPR) repeat protein